MLEASFSVAALAGLAAPLVLTGAELLARAYFRARGRAWVLAPGSKQVLEPDLEVLPQLEHEVRIEVNEDGERGRTAPADWSRTFRVLVAGGSAAECYLLDQETQWPAVLERQLAAATDALDSDGVHVGNVARSLVRCEYVEWMLRATLPRMPRLDVVVLMVGASDLVAWMERGCPGDVPRGELRPDVCFAQHDHGPFSAERPALRELAKRLERRLRPSIQRRPRAGKRIAKNRAMRAAATNWITEVPDASPMLAFYEEWLRRTIEAARAHGARVVVARQPWLQREMTPDERARLWNFGMGRPYEGEVTTYFDMPVVYELMAQVDEVSARVARELGVEACELRSRLEPSFETFYDTLHFTPQGAEQVGRLVAQAILHPGSLERAAESREAA